MPHCLRQCEKPLEGNQAQVVLANSHQYLPHLCCVYVSHVLGLFKDALPKGLIDVLRKSVFIFFFCRICGHSQWDHYKLQGYQIFSGKSF